MNVVEFHEEKSTVLVTKSFQFNTDGVFYLSQFLIESVFCSESLDDLELIKSDNFNLADEELSTLDKRLSRALTYCTFPEWWSLLGSELQNGNVELIILVILCHTLYMFELNIILLLYEKVGVDNKVLEFSLQLLSFWTPNKHLWTRLSAEWGGL